MVLYGIICSAIDKIQLLTINDSVVTTLLLNDIKLD